MCRKEFMRLSTFMTIALRECLVLNKPTAFSITPIGTLAQNLKWLLTLNGQVKVTKSLIASKWLLIRHRCLLERKSVRHFRISQKVIMNNDICSCCIKVTYHGILRPSLMHVLCSVSERRLPVFCQLYKKSF